MKPGQTLTLLLVYMMVGITVITASVMLAITSTTSVGRQVNSWQAYDVAETGVEDALMILLRNPLYTCTDRTLTVGSGVATITVTTNPPGSVVVAVGEVGNFRRTLTATTDNSGGIMTVTSWREIYP